MLRLPGIRPARTFDHPALQIGLPESNWMMAPQTLKITPAMAAKVTGKLWEMSDMVKVLVNWEAANAE
jgi:hypothetical protein